MLYYSKLAVQLYFAVIVMLILLYHGDIYIDIKLVLLFMHRLLILVAPILCCMVGIPKSFHVVVTRPLPRDEGMAEDHEAPEAGQLSRA